ncbi:uncharacterized protein LOC132552494 [Ylistrum balloti]|uniref:uncharacterized protein LOC132552494 n=1 Tax=Ylistrum balloti TaxID=509963 RepID=UPI002905A27D|nr:uncharacterized protein LOC132552494 [Ylistrum balloti]
MLNQATFVEFLAILLVYMAAEGTSCGTNPCMDVSDICLNSGTCYHDNITCQHGCHCMASFTGQRCEFLTNSVSTTTLRPLSTTSPTLTTPSHRSTTTLRPWSERQCFPGFECVHGYCDREGSGFNCLCDPGWKGIFCHEYICSCPSNAECIEEGDTFRCQTRETATKLSTTPNTQRPTPVTDNSTAIHACSANYTKRPLSERQCVPNFVCEYGACKMSDGNIGTILECVCDDGGGGGLCQELCCKPCSEYGQCKSFENGTEYCQCRFDREGDLCELKKVVSTIAPASTEVVLWPLWVSAIVLVVLLTTAALLFFWMWRNRVTIVMKIVHYFQAYEDDDEKMWDAFVSYKSADVDQDFVLHTLFPKLEKELGFTLCVHLRDFLPGETIANNIIRAIDNSRRTILVLTPRFVTSEFTRFEYQIAQQEMLKRKHKIIPILLEDISDVNDDMDPNLKQIINSVTYIEYPGKDPSEKKINHFWRKIVLSMPKKRASEQKQKQQRDMVDYKQPNGVVEMAGKNVVVKIADEQKEKENEFLENQQGTNIREWTRL